MGATLLFWGWQANYIPEGAAMAVILESSRLFKVRWEFSDDEFARVWTFCMVLFLAAMFVAFNNNGGLTDLSQLFENFNSNSDHSAGNVSAMTADALFRWLPMIFFLFAAAQTFSPGGNVPLEAISIWLRSRRKKARKKGQQLPPSRRFNFLYPYFALCLFSAAAHSSQDNYSFYYGLCFLLAWALWPERSRRFGVAVWFVVMAIATVTGFFGQRSFGQLSRLAEAYDPQIFSFLIHSTTDPKKSKTSIGEIGGMKTSGKIVIRLDPQGASSPPTYLREATYRKLDEYNAANVKQLVWDSGNTNIDFPAVTETPQDSGMWPLYPDPANRESVTIACYLEGINRDDKYPNGVLPLPTDCNRLENLKAYFVYRNTLGTVLAEGPRLMIFNATYGSGLIKDDQPEANEAFPTEDLFVPTNEVPALQKVISLLKISGTNDDDKILAVGNFFANNFKYSLWQDPPPVSGTNTTALGRFLLETRSGHCEYFATTTVLLLRKLGIPARYAVGYFVHEPSGHGYVVRLRDAHAWCIAWNKKTSSWQNVDNTPASWVADENEHVSPFQFLSDFQSWAEYEVIKFFDYSHNNIRQYIFWALIPALAFLLYRIFRGSPMHKQNDEQPEHNTWPGLDSEFYQVEQKLAQSGLRREAGEPLSVWLQRATKDVRLAKLKQPLENILLLHYRYRFDPNGLDPAERQTLRREVQTFLASASRSISTET